MAYSRSSINVSGILNKQLFHHQNGGAISSHIILNALGRAFTLLFFFCYSKVWFHTHFSFQCRVSGWEIRGISQLIFPARCCSKGNRCSKSPIFISPKAKAVSCDLYEMILFLKPPYNFMLQHLLKYSSEDAWVDKSRETRICQDL